MRGPLSLPNSVEFNRDIRPIISDRCYKCHGPDEATREAGLRLDTFEGATALLKGAENRHAIVPGKLADSEFAYRISTEDVDDVMPPSDAELNLSPAERALLLRWIEQGAAYQKHWSFMPVKHPSIPPVSNGEWIRNGIDAFVLDRLKEEGLKPSSPAEKRTLLKRVSFDLTGLPPAPDEIDSFLKDTSAQAYERVVDRLLASERYGEHMALGWVDAARYADTSGYQADWERFMWPWREWVIKAYNQNMPFDQFTIEQLAGDLLENPTLDQRLATAFNRNHRINDEGGVIAAEYAVEYVVDRVDTTATVWLGLTMGCARCHDHKYDPLSQQEFYEMFAFFNNIPEKGKDGRKGYAAPVIDYPNPAVEAERTKLNEKLQLAQKALQQETPDMVAARKEWIAEQQKRLAGRGGRHAFTPVEIAGVTAEDGTTFRRQSDGSWKIVEAGAGKKPTYEVVFPVSTGEVTAFRLEALTDSAFKGQQLAPSSNGNFVMTAFEVFKRHLETGELSPVKIDRAEADFEQDKWAVAGAIDQNPKTGWAVMGGPKGARAALFVLEESQTAEQMSGFEWVIRMKHESVHAKHLIGRFHISTTAHPEPRLKNSAYNLPEAVEIAVLAEQPSADQLATIAAHYQTVYPGFTTQREAVASTRKQIAALSSKAMIKVMVMQEMEKPRQTYVLNRGQYDQPDLKRPVAPQVPRNLGELPEDLPANRLGFAKWLVNGKNPMTARVTVNRYWQNYFGTGLVKTTEDFGAQGELPSHPKLLDWLASEFVESGWDVKSMQKLIVMSATYQQSSRMTPELIEKDPANRLLARGPRFRLSGYQLRDQALAISGLLLNRLGGPSVKPYQPSGLWAEVSFQDKKRSTDFFVQGKGEALYRRSLYTFWKRSVAPPQLATFDAAGREACSVSLVRTSTPLQALTLLNDVTYLEAARHMAARMMQAVSVEERIARGLHLASIAPDEELLGVLGQSVRDYQAHFSRQPDAAKALLQMGDSPEIGGLDTVEHAAYTALASVILNLDQTITKE